MKLFSRSAFDQATLRTYYENRIKEIKEESLITSLLADLLSPKGTDIVRSAIKDYLLRQDLTLTTANTILSKIQINIGRTDRESISNAAPYPNKNTTDTDNTKSRNKALFSINGEGSYGVGRLALAIVTIISQQNPHIYFDELKDIFNTWRENIKSIDEISKWEKYCNDKAKDQRWFERDPIVSNDGIIFAVTTQWGLFNIENIIKTGKEFGLQIEQIH